ncbi:hypothetical protein SCHPADRAFT_1001305 [Schizopora paradoxa]|uniref:Sin3 associated polypeptide p18 n=1 Tax=Schizopora paradoxa TaxID=27342 RepID=A0A0H2R7Y2_9AGAM|nr:hypothetical protein SCHPADRAFT_1001305 [Schizopora paradoxa]
MDVEAPARTVDREKTAPFLIRTFVHVGSFHPLALFDAAKLPLADEHPIYTWKDATLKEILTTLRISAPRVAELRHPQGRYAFQAVFFQAEKRGQYNKKDLGMVYSRDIIGEPGTLEQPSSRLLEDEEAKKDVGGEAEKTLEDLFFMPGDYLCVSVILPKNAKVEVGIKGAAAAAAAAASAANGTRDLAGGFSAGALRGGMGLGRGGNGGGGHWRGASDGRRPGRGGRGDPPRRGIDRDDDRRSPPPPRRYGGRDSPPPRRTTPPRRGGGGYGRDRRSRSPSGSRSPRRRNSRYD